MSLWQKISQALKGKKGLIDHNSVDREPGINMYSVSMPDLGAIWGQYSDGNLTTLYHTMGEVYIPVHIISSLVAGANWQLRKKKDDSVVYDNKYMNALLSTPNPLQNWQELIYQAEAFELVTGKNFMYANTPDAFKVNYRNVSTLVNLPADSTQIETKPILKLLSATSIEDLIQSYIVPNASEGLTKLPPDRVMYTKAASLNAYDLNIRGRSPLLSAQKAVSNLMAVYEARNVIYTSCGARGIVVSKKLDADGTIALSPTEKEDLQNEFYKNGITKGKRPIKVSAVPIEYIKITADIAELEPFQETLEDACVIFGVYQVPRELMPGNQGATFENFNNALKALYQNVIIPRALSKAQSLTNFLGLDDVDFYLHADFSHVEALQENKKEKSEADAKNTETFKTRFLFGICTLNEWMVGAGLEAIDNGFYNKRVFEMSEDELKQVERIAALYKGGAAKPNNDNQNDNQNS